MNYVKKATLKTQGTREKHLRNLSDLELHLTFLWKNTTGIYFYNDWEQIILKEISIFEEDICKEVKRRNLPYLYTLSEIIAYYNIQKFID